MELVKLAQLILLVFDWSKKLTSRAESEAFRPVLLIGWQSTEQYNLDLLPETGIFLLPRTSAILLFLSCYPELAILTRSLTVATAGSI